MVGFVAEDEQPSVALCFLKKGEPDDLTSEVAPKEDDSDKRSVIVRRGSASKEYSVPIEGADKLAVNSGKPRLPRH